MGNPRNGFRDGSHNGTGYGFGNCLTTLEKIYKDECKYSGRNNNFDHKLGIFYDMCSKANVPPDAYKTTYSTMLQGSALDYYHTNIKPRVPTARFEDMYAVT
jgi:hypothetical protein